VKAYKLGIDTPALYFVDLENSCIFMEEILGKTVKQFLFEQKDLSAPEIDSLTEAIGTNIAILHEGDIIHGDLTTSNLMLRNSLKLSLVMIDFGLSYVSTLSEDKAVDLYVLERAFIATHPTSEQLFQNILKAYGSASKRSNEVLKKLDQVRLRGRKKLAFG